jgi:hypothetical protein
MNKQKQLKVGSLVRYTGTLDPQPHDVDQFVRVHWAHDKNNDDQCYIDASLKKVEAK